MRLSFWDIISFLFQQIIIIIKSKLSSAFIEEFGLITMSTSTIEKILLSLSKQSDDKKVILNNR